MKAPQRSQCQECLCELSQDYCSMDHSHWARIKQGPLSWTQMSGPQTISTSHAVARSSGPRPMPYSEIHNVTICSPTLTLVKSQPTTRPGVLEPTIPATTHPHPSQTTGSLHQPQTMSSPGFTWTITVIAAAIIMETFPKLCACSKLDTFHALSYWYLLNSPKK